MKKNNFLFILILLATLINQASKQNIPENITKENTLKQTIEHVDIAIIGSGPAGLSAATHCGRARLHTVVIEGDTPGGQLMSTTWIENFPGKCNKILGPDLIQDLKTQAKQFGSQFITDQATSIDCSTPTYKVHTKNNGVFHAKSIIIATGVSSAQLGVTGEKEYASKGVCYCALSEGPSYKDKEVVVIGGGDSAIEDALQLSQYAKKITMLVRKDKMKAIQSSQERLTSAKNISVKYNIDVKEIRGDGTQVTSVLVSDNQSGYTYSIETSGIFLDVGCKPNTSFLQNILELDKDGYIILQNGTQQTSIPGIFAAGDVTAGKAHLAPVAAGAGTQSAVEAITFLLENATSKDNVLDYMVCFCKQILRSQIVAAIQDGCTTFESLRNKLGICSGCRSCKKEIELILQKELTK